jgi:general secretion pathway protein A
MALYLNFYGIAREPFGPTPDPDLLYLTHGHREALAQLLYAIQERKGFMLLTAEVGTGKTTLLQALRRELDDNTAVAYVSHSMLPFQAIMEYMLEEFEIAKSEESHAQRIVTLQNYLIERHRAGQNTVLILDEAQNLYPQTLEQIRLLSNFETTTEKILQILLVGQPELKMKLELPEMRQLGQRIAIRATIPPLTATGTRNYVRARLRLAGCQDPGLFTDAALARIAEYAGGIPRIVNTLCDHALLIGYADQTRRIDVEIVNEAIQYLEAGLRPGRRARPRPRRAWIRAQMTSAQWAFTGMAAGVVAGLGALMLRDFEAMSRALLSTGLYLSDLVRSAQAWLGR